MRAVNFHPLAISALAVFSMVGIGSAQTVKSSPDLLPSKQVLELVAHAKSPADHVRLAKHFTALAAKYDADAADHKALAAAYRGAPTPSETKRPGTPDTAAHCERLAQLAADAAKEARDMATMHERLANAK
jgi:hypothetical protein